MSFKGIAFLFLLVCYQANALPFFNFGQERSGLFSRKYAYPANGQATYVQYAADPVTGEQVPTHYVTHSRPGGPITALIQNVLNTVGRLVGDVGGAVGNALGGTLQGAGQLGQDIVDFMKPITVNQIVRPHPDPPLRPLPATAPPDLPKITG
ncbi:UNVERIFIED_CONTAM: hypothetical protein PYX00_000672 [Menopon gallinae]|uniref:Uncharacterized protein n=1 Tax=Menopon gallinae TaxID=328185 RepID=A0AAW2IBA0_9NEOP